MAPQAPRIYLSTLGCSKNGWDSEQMERRLTDAGFAMVGSLDEADCAIVNTCSFIQAATEESIEEVLDIMGDGRVAEERIPVIVGGCMPARYGEELSEAIPEVAAFMPCSAEDDVVSIVCGALGLDGPPRFDRAAEATEEPSAAFAYVKISDGCDRWCSYCTIPRIRGRYHSFPFEDIADDVQSKIDKGAREIVLIAQDTGRWGTDLEPSSSLAALVRTLARRHPDIWFRMMYIQPEGITDDLLEAMAEEPNICPYLDIPIQHVDGDILSSMNRSGSEADFAALVERIRTAVPDVTLRTTVIAGYPGETEEQFEALEDFLSEGHFDLIGAFPYSQEEGTRAAELPEQLDDAEKLYRVTRIRSIADAVSAARVSESVGSIEEVLVEGTEEDGQLYGRTMSQAPEVDGVTFIDGGAVGSVVPVRIEDALLYDKEGTVCDPEEGM